MLLIQILITIQNYQVSSRNNSPLIKTYCFCIFTESIFSISPMKILGENNSMDGEMDNVSLSSFLGHLEHGNRMNNNYSNDVKS